MNASWGLWSKWLASGTAGSQLTDRRVVTNSRLNLFLVGKALCLCWHFGLSLNAGRWNRGCILGSCPAHRCSDVAPTVIFILFIVKLVASLIHSIYWNKYNYYTRMIYFVSLSERFKEFPRMSRSRFHGIRSLNNRCRVKIVSMVHAKIYLVIWTVSLT